MYTITVKGPEGEFKGNADEYKLKAALISVYKQIQTEKNNQAAGKEEKKDGKRHR